jgi:hypothetical protein
MELNILHSDITSGLCQRCAACCRIQITVSNTDSRYRRFLRKIGYTILPPPQPGEDDCCGDRHDIKLDMGHCRHLEHRTEQGETTYRCRLYGTSDFPELCAEFDCVSWARFGNSYNESNSTLMTAQRALNKRRNQQALESHRENGAETGTP